MDTVTLSSSATTLDTPGDVTLSGVVGGVNRVGVTVEIDAQTTGGFVWVRSPVTDATGAYTVTLPVNETTIFAAKANTAISSTVTVTVTAPAVPIPDSVTLSSSATTLDTPGDVTLTGVVGGVNKANVTVDLYSKTTGAYAWNGSTTSDATGAFTVTATVDQDTTFVARANTASSTPVTVTVTAPAVPIPDSVTLAADETSLPAPGTVTFTGVVGGVHKANVTVDLYSKTTGAYAWNGSTTSDATGDFTVTATVEQDTTFVARANTASSTPVAIDVVALRQATLSLSVPASHTGVGNVALSGVLDAVNAADVVVDIYSKTTGAYQLIETAVTDASGHYTVTTGIRRTTSFLARTGTVSSSARTVTVNSVIYLTLTAAGHSRVAVRAAANPQVTSTVTFYQVVGAKKTKILTATTAANGVIGFYWTTTKGAKTVEVDLSSPGTTASSIRKTVGVV
jgi:5-hydroxyisourate hydrolase-like protein (transthyretin family)